MKEMKESYIPSSPLVAWLPFILSVLIIAGGGLATATWLQYETQALRREVEAVKRKREEDREILIEIRADVKQLRREIDAGMGPK